MRFPHIILAAFLLWTILQADSSDSFNDVESIASTPIADDPFELVDAYHLNYAQYQYNEQDTLLWNQRSCKVSPVGGTWDSCVYYRLYQPSTNPEETFQYHHVQMLQQELLTTYPYRAVPTLDETGTNLFTRFAVSTLTPFFDYDTHMEPRRLAIEQFLQVLLCHPILSADNSVKHYANYPSPPTASPLPSEQSLKPTSKFKPCWTEINTWCQETLESIHYLEFIAKTKSELWTELLTQSSAFATHLNMLESKLLLSAENRHINFESCRSNRESAQASLDRAKSALYQVQLLRRLVTGLFQMSTRSHTFFQSKLNDLILSRRYLGRPNSSKNVTEMLDKINCDIELTEEHQSMASRQASAELQYVKSIVINNLPTIAHQLSQL